VFEARKQSKIKTVSGWHLFVRRFIENWIVTYSNSSFLNILPYYTIKIVFFGTRFSIVSAIAILSTPFRKLDQPNRSS